MHLQLPHCVKCVGEQETVTFGATKHITELGVYKSISFFTALDDFQTPFLTLKKARPFVVTLNRTAGFLLCIFYQRHPRKLEYMLCPTV